MWHPPLATFDGNEEKAPEVGKDKKLQDEEERLIQLALKKSLEPVKVHCQFCKVELDNHEQVHHLNCVAIETTKLTFAEQDEQHCPVQVQGEEQHVKGIGGGPGQSLRFSF